MAMGFLGSRRWWVAVVVVLAVVVLGTAGWMSRATPGRAASVRPAASSTLASCPPAVRRLGKIALLARGRLELVDLADCRVTVLPARGAGQVRFSPDGRWLAYGQDATGANPSGPVVIPLHGRGGGGAARLPLGRGVIAWTWGASEPMLYGITGGGVLVAAAPHGPRRKIATGVNTGSFGIDSPLALSPNGQAVAVDRSACQPPTVGELDTVNLRTGARTVAVRRPGAFFTLAGWSADGHWLLFWAASQCSGSLAADGWPLEAVPASGGAAVRVVPHMLLYDDYLSWCGSRLIVAAGPDRQSNMDSKLLSVAPPGWRARTMQPARTLSWVSPSCASTGNLLAAAAGPNSADAGFGVEHRSIWLLQSIEGGARRLTLPPASDLSDEAPRFSRDGRWLMFVRSHVISSGVVASSRDTIELVRTDGAGGTIPILSFSSGDFSYYDHFDWPYEIAWYDP